MGENRNGTGPEADAPSHVEQRPVWSDTGQGVRRDEHVDTGNRWRFSSAVEAARHLGTAAR